MKLLSKTKLFSALLLCLGLGTAWGLEDGLFTKVPPQDPTYARLEKLAQAKLLSESDVTPPLTRYEVAKLILKARENYQEMHMAQAKDTGDTLIESTEEAGHGTAGTKAQAVENPEEAAKNLYSLEDAYQYELKEVRDLKKSLADRFQQADTDQNDIWKRLQGVQEKSSVSIHGLGRAWGLSQDYSNVPSSLNLPGSSERYGSGFLDLAPTGSVSKEIRWQTMFRISSDLLQNNSNTNINLRRIEIDFNPSWFSLNLGDFYEAYTPFTLWNRDNLDLKYKPEMMARQDDFSKYTSFLNREPEWPLRGIRIGTDVMWPDSEILDEWQSSVFADLVRNGYDDANGGYFGASVFSDWVFAGKTKLKLKKGYFPGWSEQFSIEAFGLILDEPLYTNTPGSVYNPGDPSTWAHQYMVGSFRPQLEVGLGDGFSMGAIWEAAIASYQADKMVPERFITDMAMLGGPYLKFGESKISFNYLKVNPNYYSPLAQTRQDLVTQIPGIGYVNSPELFTLPLRGIASLPNIPISLPNIPEPAGVFTFYDRTQDNTFPYGLGTPNRQGGGVELDIQTLEKKALKILGSAYLVEEIESNLVNNPGFTGYVPVDTPSGMSDVSLRNFTYVNIGPSFNLSPSLGLDRDLELGTNVRYEQTTSSIGTLTSSWIMGGLRTDVLPFLEISGAYSYQYLNGAEVGYGGSPYARYSYLYDNSDLGKYSVFNVDGNIQSWMVSGVVKINKNSNLYLDYDWTQGTNTPVAPLNIYTNQFVEVTYEVQF